MQAAISWGAMENWDDVPADIAFRLKYLRGVYNAFRGYAEAGARNDTVGWTKANPGAWDLVTKIMAERRRAARELAQRGGASG